MPADPQDNLSKLHSLRDLALTILIAGGAQILLALILWPILFGCQPLGFALALSLVGFGNWALSALSSFGLGRRRRRGSQGKPAAQQQASPIVARVQEQLGRAGCSFVLFLSSLMPLALAFVIRLRADLRSGLTWQELFPPFP